MLLNPWLIVVVSERSCDGGIREPPSLDTHSHPAVLQGKCSMYSVAVATQRRAAGGRSSLRVRRETSDRQIPNGTIAWKANVRSPFFDTYVLVASTRIEGRERNGILFSKSDLIMQVRSFYGYAVDELFARFARSNSHFHFDVHVVGNTPTMRLYAYVLQQTINSTIVRSKIPSSSLVFH